MNNANIDNVMLANTYLAHDICRKRYSDMIACIIQITCDAVSRLLIVTRHNPFSEKTIAMYVDRKWFGTK